MAIQDDIWNLVTQSFTDPVHSLLSQALTVESTFLTVVMLCIGIFWGVRAVRRYGMYAGKGSGYGPYSIHFLSGEGYVHGNLSKNLWFDEDSFNKIKKQEPEYNMDYSELENMMKSEQIVIYDFKVTDHSRVWGVGKDQNDLVLIANGKMTSDDFSILEKNGRFSLTAPLFRETARTVGAFSMSKHYPMSDPYGKKVDVWYIQMIPQKADHVMSNSITGERYVIEINHIGNMESVAKSAVNLPALLAQEDENAKLTAELKEWRKMCLKEQDRNKSLNTLVNQQNHFLGKKLFVGDNRRRTLQEKRSELAFIVLAFFGAVGSYEEVPKMFHDINGNPTIQPMIVAIAILVILIALREIMNKKKPDQDDDLIEADRNSQF